MMGHFSEEIDFDNYEPYEVIQAIMEQFIIFTHKVREKMIRKEMENSQMLSSKKREPTDLEMMLEWKYSLSSMRKGLQRTKDMEVGTRQMV